MTINIFVLKGDLNGEIVVVHFFFCRVYLSYDITFTLKPHFWRQKVIIASLYTQLCYERHNVSQKSVNH